jgi:hypothetical protein
MRLNLNDPAGSAAQTDASIAAGTLTISGLAVSTPIVAVDMDSKADPATPK